MVSRDFISGFLMGVGISSGCYGLYLMYIGNKLIQLNKTMEMEITNRRKSVELNIISDVD